MNGNYELVIKNDELKINRVKITIVGFSLFRGDPESFRGPDRKRGEFLYEKIKEL